MLLLVTALIAMAHSVWPDLQETSKFIWQYGDTHEHHKIVELLT